MRLIDRITTLLKADAHGVVESIEDQRLLGKQLLRDARIALDEKRAELADLKNQQRRLEVESKRLLAVIARLDQEVTFAMDSREEDLARAAIRKLLPLREAHRRLSDRLVTLRDEEARSSARIDEQERELEVLKARLSAELSLSQNERADEGFERQVITEDDVELELLRRRQVTKTEVDVNPAAGEP